MWEIEVLVKGHVARGANLKQFMTGTARTLCFLSERAWIR